MTAPTTPSTVPTTERAPARHARWPWIVVAAATAVLGTSFLDWGRSGESLRTPYELRRSVLAIEFLDGTAETLLRWAWPLVPPLVGALWLCAAFRRFAAVRILGGTVGGIALATGWAVWRSPLVPTGGLRVGTAVAALLLVAVCIPPPRFAPLAWRRP